MLPPNVSGGPHNLGDPEDRTLRKVEKDIMIPMKMRDKAKKEKCFAEGKSFTECCKDARFWMVWKCKSETATLTNCLENWYKDEEFKRQCTEEYLEERSEYRRTGIKQKQKRKDSVII